MAIRLATVLILLLLFVDDIAMPSCLFPVLQRLMDSLGCFADNNILAVNLAKTAWLVGGFPPCDGVDPSLVLRYKGAVVSHVSHYKYLGLHLDGSASMREARRARL